MSWMQKDLNYYINKFRNLRVNTSGGKTPYQPILLLSVFELIGQGYISENKIYLTTTLMSIFVKYRSQLSPPKYQADLAQPFFFLSRSDEPFWHLHPKSGSEEVLKSGSRLNTINLLMRNIDYAQLDDELFTLLQTPINRNALIAVVTTRWFSDKSSSIKIFEIVPLQNTYSDLERNEELLLASERQHNVLYDVNRNDIEAMVRDATFGIYILKAPSDCPSSPSPLYFKTREIDRNPLEARHRGEVRVVSHSNSQTRI